MSFNEFFETVYNIISCDQLLIVVMAKVTGMSKSKFAYNPEWPKCDWVSQPPL